MDQELSVATGADPDVARMNPRTLRVRQVILDAAVELLLTEGAEQVTATRVAEYADVARTTIYRQWPDQGSLLLATIDALTTPHHSTTTTGRLADDVRASLGNLRRRLTTRDVRAVFGALAANAAWDGAFVAAQQRFVQQLIQPTVDILEAAHDRGELDPDIDFQFEASLLAGPVLHQYLVLHDDVTDRLIDETTDRWLATHGSG